MPWGVVDGRRWGRGFLSRGGGSGEMSIWTMCGSVGMGMNIGIFYCDGCLL